jgi:prepilin-type N-terminal cleavage/methylation domain-containing protein
MQKHSSKKSGFTLVEVVVVVAIMGILTTMGVAGLRGAVLNARMKDCAVNVTAFLERIANESNRMSKRLCVKVAHDTEQELQVFEPVDGSCNVDRPPALYDVYNLESPARFSCDNDAIDLDEFGTNWGDGAMFVPRIGISAAPTEGYLCMQYGDDLVFARAQKEKNNNVIVPWWRTGGVWMKL